MDPWFFRVLPSLKKTRNTNTQRLMQGKYRKREQLERQTKRRGTIVFVCLFVVFFGVLPWRRRGRRRRRRLWWGAGSRPSGSGRPASSRAAPWAEWRWPRRNRPARCTPTCSGSRTPTAASVIITAKNNVMNPRKVQRQPKETVNRPGGRGAGRRRPRRPPGRRRRREWRSGRRAPSGSRGWARGPPWPRRSCPGSAGPPPPVSCPARTWASRLIRKKGTKNQEPHPLLLKTQTKKPSLNLGKHGQN